MKATRRHVCSALWLASRSLPTEQGRSEHRKYESVRLRQKVLRSLLCEAARTTPTLHPRWGAPRDARGRSGFRSLVARRASRVGLVSPQHQSGYHAQIPCTRSSLSCQEADVVMYAPLARSSLPGGLDWLLQYGSPPCEPAYRDRYPQRTSQRDFATLEKCSHDVSVDPTKPLHDSCTPRPALNAAADGGDLLAFARLLP